MKDEIVEFFAEKNIPVSKIISVGTVRHGLPADAIKQAINEVYERRDDIQPIRLAWEVFSAAKYYRTVKDDDNYATTKELKGQIEQHRQEIEEHRQEITKLSKILDWYKTRNLWKRIVNKEYAA